LSPAPSDRYTRAFVKQETIVVEISAERKACPAIASLAQYI